jgi:RimJ/RimL family protein N-acetyltransferase
VKLTLKPPNRRLARPLETARFTLRPLGLIEMLKVTESWRADPAILTGFFHSPRPLSRLMWLHKGRMPNNVDRFAFAIVPRGERAPIGVHTIRIGGRPTDAVNGIGIHDRAWWGGDVVVEVRTALMRHFFANGGIELFLGYVYERNLNSIFVYRRMGFAYKGLAGHPKRNPATGEVADLMAFEMPRARWEAGPFGKDADER